MKTLPTNAFAAGATCAVASHALVEARISEIAALRDQPAPPGVPPLPPRFLRHCDEQTAVGMRAVLEAIAGYPAPRPVFDQFGVIASSCAAGRLAAAQTLAQLEARGTAAVSPHIVPQCSLHAMASAVSVAFGMHGPNIGTSGGAQALSEGLFTAFTFLQGSSPPGNAGCDGIWLIVSEWDEEPLLDAVGKPLNDPLCRAVAMALTPCPDAAASPRNAAPRSLTLRLHRDRADDRPADGAGQAQSLAAFAQALTMCGEGGALESWSHACPWAAEVRVVAGTAGGQAVRDHARDDAIGRRKAA